MPLSSSNMRADGIMPHAPGFEIGALIRFVDRHPRLFVLTGAGVSTESGIPGYRDTDGRWMRSAPMRIEEFLRTTRGYRRYWFRSMSGWPQLARARPNAAHHALAKLEALGRISELVTQNVDGLHQRAGSMHVIELHGNVHRALCVECGSVQSRASVQERLVRENALSPASASASLRPDGDAEAADANDDFDRFVAPACDVCNGMLKPDVVFFGEGVPHPRVAAARDALACADALLVVGSSLMVYSGYRFCIWAAEMGKPVAAINLGRTRADALLAMKMEHPCGDALTALVDELTTKRSSPSCQSTVA
jgi:NAD-dependent SIR2 family protein deacetylase